MRVRQVAEGGRQCQPVHVGHRQVDERDVDVRAVAHPADRLVRRAGCADGHPPLAQLGNQDAPVRRAVVDDQRDLAVQPDRGPRRTNADGVGGRLGRDDPDDEAAALARHAAALDGDRAPLQLGQALADRESEARPAEPSRDRGVRLAERLEQPVDAVRRDADARVADRDVDFPAPLSGRPATGPAATGRPETDTTTSPASVNLTAFERRLRTIWRSRPASPVRACGSFGSSA